MTAMPDSPTLLLLALGAGLGELTVEKHAALAVTHHQKEGQLLALVGIAVLLLMAASPAWAGGALSSTAIVDGWYVPCDGRVHTSPQVILSSNSLYIKRAYMHGESPAGTMLNLWLVSAGVTFGVLNEYHGGLAWSTARDVYGSDWIYVPPGDKIVAQGVCDGPTGAFMVVLAVVWFTSAP